MCWLIVRQMNILNMWCNVSQRACWITNVGFCLFLLSQPLMQKLNPWSPSKTNNKKQTACWGLKGKNNAEFARSHFCIWDFLLPYFNCKLSFLTSSCAHYTRSSTTLVVPCWLYGAKLLQTWPTARILNFHGRHKADSHVIRSMYSKFYNIFQRFIQPYHE